MGFHVLDSAGKTKTSIIAVDAGSITSGTLADARMPGAWTNVAFAAGNFTANGTMTWTVALGDQVSYKYRQYNKTLIVSFRIDTSDVGGVVNNALFVAVPGGFTAKGLNLGTLVYSDAGGAFTLGICLITDGSALIQCGKSPAANFTATGGAGNTYIWGEILMEIN